MAPPDMVSTACRLADAAIASSRAKSSELFRPDSSSIGSDSMTKDARHGRRSQHRSLRRREQGAGKATAVARGAGREGGGGWD
jgi:hypothetical protein